MISNENLSEGAAWTPQVGNPQTLFPEAEALAPAPREGSNRGGFHGYGDRPDSLIQGILQLYFQISSRLVQFRVDRSETRAQAAADIDVAEHLIARVREHAAASAPAAGDPISPTTASDQRLQAIGATGSRTFGAGWVGTGQPAELGNELALHLAKGPRAGVLQPRIGEQLKRRTFGYINQALDLAKQGKLAAAETCAKLAESALKTAAGFLSPEEFHEFQREVMARVHGVDDRVN